MAFYMDSARAFLDNAPRSLLRQSEGNRSGAGKAARSSIGTTTASGAGHARRKAWAPTGGVRNSKRASPRSPAAQTAHDQLGYRGEYLTETETRRVYASVDEGLEGLDRINAELDSLGQDLAFKRTLFRAQFRTLRDALREHQDKPSDAP